MNKITSNPSIIRPDSQPGLEHPSKVTPAHISIVRSREIEVGAVKYKTLILGASYGSLLAIKLLLAGHSAKLVCRSENAALVNNEGQRVLMPVRGRDGLLEIDSRHLPGDLSAATPDAVNPTDFDLVVLAMQEPQYCSPSVRELLDAVAPGSLACPL